MDRRPKLIKPTFYFLLAGLVIGGFTAIALIGIQRIFQFILQDCEKAWIIYIIVTFVGSALTPLFYWRKLNSSNGFGNSDIWIFNLLQYMFLQGALTVFWTNANTFCNVIDGQNGWEFIFTAFIALPMIFLVNLIFERILKHKPNTA